MIKLTDTNGRPLWMNPEHVVDVTSRVDGGVEKTFVLSVVDIQDSYPRTVTESPEEVVRKIVEYKLEMLFSSSLGDAMDITYHLAGLEADSK